jgi:hypothetical protein
MLRPRYSKRSSPLYQIAYEALYIPWLVQKWYEEKNPIPVPVSAPVVQAALSHLAVWTLPVQYILFAPNIITNVRHALTL